MTSERHPLGRVVGCLHADISRFEAKKKTTWSSFIANETPLVLPSSLNLVCPSSEATSIVFWDCHNVADFDFVKFVAICSELNTRGIESKVISFVGRGTATHCGVLNTFSHPVLQQVITELILVFDRKSLQKGKGHVIKEWEVSHPGQKVIFVDDGVENLENVHRFDLAECLLIHFVIEPTTRDVETPSYATRVETFEHLTRLISDFLSKN